MRLLLLASSLFLSGCSLLRQPTAIPVDFVVRPKVEVALSSPASVSGDWLDYMPAVAVGLLLLCAWLLLRKSGKR